MSASSIAPRPLFWTTDGASSFRRVRLRLLLALTVIGFVVPNVFVGVYLAEEGLALGEYFEAWYSSTPQTQLTVDITLAALAFVFWASWDGPRSGVKSWWVVIPATFLVGLCFGLPLYLYLREKALAEPGAPAPA